MRFPGLSGGPKELAVTGESCRVINSRSPRHNTGVALILHAPKTKKSVAVVGYIAADLQLLLDGDGVTLGALILARRSGVRQH